MTCDARFYPYWLTDCCLRRWPRWKWLTFTQIMSQSVRVNLCGMWWWWWHAMLEREDEENVEDIDHVHDNDNNQIESEEKKEKRGREKWDEKKMRENCIWLGQGKNFSLIDTFNKSTSSFRLMCRQTIKPCRCKDSIDLFSFSSSFFFNRKNKRLLFFNPLSWILRKRAKKKTVEKREEEKKKQ